jgi:hypothetical protein
MAEERLSYTDTLARLDERLKSVETRLSQPMRCVEGALVAQRLDQMAEALKDLVAIREEDRRAIAAHERRLQALEDGVQIRVAQITAIAAIVGGSVTVLGQLVLKAITRG